LVLDKSLVAIELKRSKSKTEIDMTDSELKAFLDDECNL
jgi:hypothetical protein